MMTFVNVRELKNHTSAVLRRARKGNVVVTSRGKPTALLIRLTEDQIDDLVLQSPAMVRSYRKSLAEYRRKGGKTLEQVRKEFGLSS